MSGTTIRIFPPRNFDFSKLAAGQSLTMALAERIGASQYTSADILVRVHSLTISGSAKIEVQLYAEAWTPDDPLKTFAKTLATATIDGQTQVNDLVDRVGLQRPRLDAARRRQGNAERLRRHRLRRAECRLGAQGLESRRAVAPEGRSPNGGMHAEDAGSGGRLA
ncbi:MAG: hypothetical protein M5U28_31410 [Sandaracinaceae bacterium]|nr:hypothetical protein [Sandaracinaceae bacterium]